MSLHLPAAIASRPWNMLCYPSPRLGTGGEREPQLCSSFHTENGGLPALSQMPVNEECFVLVARRSDFVGGGWWLRRPRCFFFSTKLSRRWISQFSRIHSASLVWPTILLSPSMIHSSSSSQYTSRDITQLAKMSFDKIFDLTAGAYLNLYSTYAS